MMDTEPKPEEKTVAKTEAEKPANGQPKKKSLLKRIVKGVLWLFGGLLVFAIMAALTLPLWINPVATSLAGSIVPGYTGTPFELERVNLNPYTGKLFISGVRLANPEGYSEKDAFTLGSLSAEFETMSLLSDTIRIHDVTIDSPYASWVFDAAGSNNFDRIVAAVNEKLGPKKEKEEKGETKVIVDKVTIKNVRAVVGQGVFELASLSLTDFGKDNVPAKVEIAGVKLVNPKGFPEPDAFSLKSLSIGMETGDLKKKPLVFHDIIVDATYAGLVYNDAGDSNFDVLLKPFRGEEKKEKSAADEKKDKADDGGPGVTIDKLDISGTKLQYRKLTLPVPLPTFTDIGKTSKEGATVKEVANQVIEKAKGSVGGLGDMLDSFGGAALHGITGATTNMLGGAKDLIAGGATNMLGGAKDLIAGGATNVLGGTKEKLGNAVDATKGLIGGMLPGGDKKDDGKKDDEKKKDGAEPGVMDKAKEGAKGLLNKVNPF
jgi:hypothetical protein